MISLSDDGVEDNNDGFVVRPGGGRRCWAFAPLLHCEVTLRLVKSMMSLAARHTAEKSACELVQCCQEATMRCANGDGGLRRKSDLDVW